MVNEPGKCGASSTCFGKRELPWSSAHRYALGEPRFAIVVYYLQLHACSLSRKPINKRPMTGGYELGFRDLDAVEGVLLWYVEIKWLFGKIGLTRVYCGAIFPLILTHLKRGTGF